MVERAPAQVPVPGRHVLVCEAGGDVKHDDGALAVDVVAIPQPTELLLAGCVPAVETQLAPVSSEVQRVHLHTDGGCTGTPTKSAPGHSIAACLSWQSRAEIDRVSDQQSVSAARLPTAPFQVPSHVDWARELGLGENRARRSRSYFFSNSPVK